MTTDIREAGDAKLFSIVGWSSNYRIDWLRFDLIAGLTAAAVAILQAIAYATIAGLPVEVGLHTILMPVLIFALLGISRLRSVSLTSTIAMQSATVLASVVPDVDH